MAQDIEVKVKVETGDASNNVNRLEGSINKLGNTTKRTNEQSKDYAKEIIGNSKLTGALSKATGGLSDAFINAARGVDFTSFSLKGLKAAIASTGVGLLVIGLTELVNILVDVFDKTEESAKATENYTKQIENSQKALDGFNSSIDEYSKLQDLKNKQEHKTLEQQYQDLVYFNKKRLQETEWHIKDKEKLLEEAKNNELLTEEDRVKSINEIEDKLTELKEDRHKVEFEGTLMVEEEKLRVILKADEDKKKLEAEKEKRDAEAIAFRKQQVSALQALEKRFNEDIQNLDDKTGQEKLTRQKERALKELEAIKLSETEKAKAKELIIKDFAIKQELFEAEQQNKIISLTNQYEKDKQDILAKSDQEKLNLQRQREAKKLEDDLKLIEVSETQKQELRLQLEQKYALLQTELDNKTNQEDAAESQKVLEDIQNSDTATLEQRQAALESETALVQKQFDSKLITEEQYNAKVKFLAEQRKKIGDLEVAWKRAQVGNMGNAFAQLATLAGESTAAGKAFAVAAATISTFQSAQAAYQSAFMPAPTLASPVLGAIYAGVAVAGGLANIQKILAVKTPGGSGGGGGGISAPAAAPQFNVVGASGVNQLSESLNVQNRDADKPVKAYVVSSDVTTAQGLDRNIIRNATLGG
jgi:hypothetical protein